MSQGKNRVGGKGQGRAAAKKTAKPKKKKKRAQIQEPPAVIDPDLALVIKRPIRVQIVAIAHQRLISPIEFAEGYDYPLSYVSDHFQVLVRADFLELVDEVKVRGTVKHMYRATKRAFVSDFDWKQLAKPVQDGWSGAFIQDLNGRLTDASEAGTLNSRDDRCLFWIAMTLDETSWSEFTKMLAWAIKEGKELGVETVERRARGEGNGCIPVTFAVMGFESPRESARKRLKPGERRKRQAPKEKGGTKRRGTKDKPKGRKKGGKGRA